MSVHYWAPTVLSPDGKPFDKKLIKVLHGLPTVNVLIIVFLYEDELNAENVILVVHILLVSREHRPVRRSGGSLLLTTIRITLPFAVYSDVTLFYIPNLVLVFHLAGCLCASESQRPSL